VQQFLGICNYYRRYIKDYSKMAAPLFSLLKKDEKFIWNELQQKAFEQLRNALISYPVLRQPDLTRPFSLYTDASGFALGSVLSQEGDDKKDYPVAYYSRILKGAEIHYGISEKECLSIVAAIKHFRVYLHGMKFKVITDHSALAWLMNITEPTGKLARWAIYLQAFEFEIIYRKGSVHANANALRRPVMSLVHISNNSEDDSEISQKSLDVYEDETLMYYLKNGKFEAGQSKKQIKRVELLAKKYFFEDESVFIKTNEGIRKVPKINERSDIVLKAHLLGHFQSETTLKRIKENSACFLDATPKEEYKYLQTLVFIGFICEVKPTLIIGKNFDSLLFGKECRVRDLYC